MPLFPAKHVVQLAAMYGVRRRWYDTDRSLRRRALRVARAEPDRYARPVHITKRQWVWFIFLRWLSNVFERCARWTRP